MARIEVDPERCKGCKLCLAACPFGLVQIGENINQHGYYYAVQVNAEKCTGCTMCAIMCPDSAIQVYKEV